MRSTAWTVPVIAVAVGAPAFAASCGTTLHDYRLDWGPGSSTTPYSRSVSGGTQSGVATLAGPTGTVPLAVTFTSTVVGTDRRTSNNLTVDATTYPDVANSGGTGLLLQHQNIRVGRDVSRQVVTIAFDRAVTDLEFTISDIDSNNAPGGSNDFWDRIELTGARTFRAVSRGRGGDYVEGEGTEDSPWQMYDNDVVAGDNGDDKGNVTVSYTAPVTSITLTYWNARGNGNQAVFLGDFTFKAKGC